MIKISIIEEHTFVEAVFLEILLKEKYVGGEIQISKDALCKAGGVNKQLKAKQDYELLLRLARNYRLQITEIKDQEAEEPATLFFPEVKDAFSKLETDCYVIGRYKEELLEKGYFGAAVENILMTAQASGIEQKVIFCLEQMLKKEEAFYKIDDVTRPVLVYKGSNVCHDVLNVFAKSFGEALKEAGQAVEYYDTEENGIEGLVTLIGKRYRAIVGFQTYVFTIKMKDGETYLHNLIGGKKYNFIFDHPIWLLPHLQHQVEEFFVLTHDCSYIRFIKKYYGKRARLLPPGGLQHKLEKGKRLEKRYGLSFVGTYGDYIHEVRLIHGMERSQRFIANGFLLAMRQNPNLTAEQALQQTLRKRGLALSEDSFLVQFYALRRVIYCVMHYYRHQVIKEILKEGIRLEVFGDSWLACPLREYDNLVCHPNVTVEESLEIWKRSKMSLNIMSWHKEGFTERVANSMLSGAVVVTDQSTYLHTHFEDGEEIILFDLENLSALPNKIKEVLGDDSKREKMAESALEKALQNHTWQVRVKQFLALLEEEETK